MSIPSIFSLVILISGILMVECDRGIMEIIMANAPGGMMARWLIPISIVLPAVLGWLRWYAQFRLGAFDTPVGLSIFAASNIIITVVLLWVSANLLNRADISREHMRFMASHDVLTSLLNRKGIMEVLEREISLCKRDGEPLSVLLADVDHFKSVNDTLGHQTGDDVLREIAERLRNAVREDDYVGRLGGEEFLLVLPGCDLETAVSRAEYLRQQIADGPVHAGDYYRNVTVSLGAASISDNSQGESSEVLISQADEALYSAKQGGRNQVRASISVLPTAI
jgi:diguanylate cyclase (GGDEF)-like protein